MRLEEAAERSSIDATVEMNDERRPIILLFREDEDNVMQFNPERFQSKWLKQSPRCGPFRPLSSHAMASFQLEFPLMTSKSSLMPLPFSLSVVETCSPTYREYARKGGNDFPSSLITFRLQSENPRAEWCSAPWTLGISKSVGLPESATVGSPFCNSNYWSQKTPENVNINVEIVKIQIRDACLPTLLIRNSLGGVTAKWYPSPFARCAHQQSHAVEKFLGEMLRNLKISVEFANLSSLQQKISFPLIKVAKMRFLPKCNGRIAAECSRDMLWSLAIKFHETVTFEGPHAKVAPVQLPNFSVVIGILILYPCTNLQVPLPKAFFGNNVNNTSQ